MGTIDRRQFLSTSLGAGALAGAAHVRLPRHPGIAASATRSPAVRTSSVPAGPGNANVMGLSGKPDGAGVSASLIGASY